jgi:acetolactate synthase-1/2/3 large subunit
VTTRPALNESTSVGEAVFDVLEDAGIELIFGLRGGHTSKMLGALQKRAKLKYISVRQETVATQMAETVGRLTGRPGVVMGQGPWMSGWGFTGLVEAARSGSPLVMLTDFCDVTPYALHAPYQAVTGHYGTTNLEQMLNSIVKQVFVVRESAEAAVAVQLAIKHAMTGTPGPTAVVMTGPAVDGPIGPESVPRLYPTQFYLPSGRQPADPESVRSAAAAIERAQRPVIVAGNGIRVGHGYAELQELAERIQAPVTTSLAGKGCFPENHVLALGVMGSYGHPTANAYLAEADLVLAIGTRLGVSDTGNAHPALIDPSRQAIVQIDIEPRNVGWTFPVEHGLVGDAATVVRQLMDELPESSARGDATPLVAKLRDMHGFFDGDLYECADQPIAPPRVMAELMRALPEDSIVTCDAGANRLWTTRFFQTKKAGGYVHNGTGSMGYAVPSAIAVKLLHPEKPVVAVCGDGGFAMTMNGLFTALEQKLGIVVVVLNNHTFAHSLHGTGVELGTQLGDVDHAAIAKGMGCEGVRVADPADLAAALDEALGRSVPTVIDVVVSPEMKFAEVSVALASFKGSTDLSGYSA